MAADRPAGVHQQQGQQIDGIEPDQPEPHELHAAQAFLEAAVVGVGQDPATQQEEEVDRQVAVGNERAAEKTLAMPLHDDQRRDAAKPGEGDELGLGRRLSHAGNLRAGS